MTIGVIKCGQTWIKPYDIYIYTMSEKSVNDQSYGVLDRYGITIVNDIISKINYKRLKWFVSQRQVYKTKY